MFLGHIYYAIGLIVVIFLINNITKFSSYYHVQEWVKKYFKVTGKQPIREDFRSEQEYTDYTMSSGFSVLYSFWIIGGILTGSWYIFLGLMLYTLLTNLLVLKINIEPMNKLLSLKLVYVRLIVISYLVINHFHLHYDTWQLFLNWIR